MFLIRNKTKLTTFLIFPLTLETLKKSSDVLLFPKQYHHGVHYLILRVVNVKKGVAVKQAGLALLEKGVHCQQMIIHIV